MKVSVTKVTLKSKQDIELCSLEISTRNNVGLRQLDLLKSIKFNLILFHEMTATLNKSCSFNSVFALCRCQRCSVWKCHYSRKKSIITTRSQEIPITVVSVKKRGIHHLSPQKYHEWKIRSGIFIQWAPMADENSTYASCFLVVGYFEFFKTLWIVRVIIMFQTYFDIGTR